MFQIEIWWNHLAWRIIVDVSYQDSRGIVKAKVPLSEMFGYVTALRTISSGRATSSMEFSHYAEVSTAIAKEVVAEAKGHVELL